MMSVSDSPQSQLLSGLDLQLFGEGRHHRLWEVLGSFPELGGCRFAVWAPNAKRVGVAGDWNSWYGLADELAPQGNSGVWAGFVAGVMPGMPYKFEIEGPDGETKLKADPMARRAEVPPGSASLVDVSTYGWNDTQWVANRTFNAETNPAIRIYEVHLGSWRIDLRDYRSIATALADYVVHLGFTHVELMPVMEHPYGGSWGYQVTGYFAPTSRFGSPDDFRAFVDILHQKGIGVLLDWVPAHFPKDDWALARFDGTALYEHLDPKQGEHPDWGTYIFNYGRPEVKNFLIANALFWLDEFHIDGLRVDAVASMLYLDYSRPDGEWVPNKNGGRENLEAIAFLQEMNTAALEQFPSTMMIAEESTAWPKVTAPAVEGGLGFTHKWNMGWMHDTLEYLGEEAEQRPTHHSRMSFGQTYASTERFVLPLSHDEVVHGKGSLVRKMAGDDWQKFANLRALYGWMWAYPGAKLLFAGNEFAQWNEWSEAAGLEWPALQNEPQRAVFELIRTMNRVAMIAPPLWELDDSPAGFEWLSVDDKTSSVYAFLRWSSDRRQAVACVANFQAAHRPGYRVGLPWGGLWSVLLNTDSRQFGGTNEGVVGAVKAENIKAMGQPSSVVLHVPPLGVVWLGSGK
jgi:1,4-alpha-glucan branching enzyme